MPNIIQEAIKGDAFLARDYVDELIDEPQIYPPSETIEEIHDRIEEVFLEASLFKNAYADLDILDGSLEGHIFKLDYRLKRDYRAHAYFKRREDRSSSSKCVSLIIPGSRNNSSSSTFRKDPNSNHGNILAVTEKYGDTFIYIKPNQDILAIHNGRNKLDVRSLIAYLLNRGGSYAAHYITSCMAITRYLQSRYDKVFVIGLSQGGAATLYSSLQSKPTAAVVASGFSVINQTYYRWSINQIIIPGLDVDFGLEEIRTIIKESPTRYLFVWGKQEQGAYRIESEEGYTGHFFQGLDNVACIAHEGGHIYPQDVVDRFLHQQLRRD
jgi:hypothetical protein